MKTPNSITSLIFISHLCCMHAQVNVRIRVRDNAASVGNVPNSDDSRATITSASCATENTWSKFCDAKGGEDVCCAGLVCHEYQTWRCVTEEKRECSDVGTLAIECGSSYLEASPSCCPGLVCDTDAMTCVLPS